MIEHDELSRRALLRWAGLGAAGATLTAGCGEAREVADQQDAITIKDQRGTTVELPRPAKRVVTVPMPAAAMVIAVDKSAAHLVAMHRASWTAIRDGLLGELFPQARKIAHDVATQDFAPNVESIVALDPDVVVQWGDEGGSIVAPLENAGLDVLGLTYGTQRDVETWITVFGAMLGKKDRAGAMNARLRRRLAEIKEDAPPTGGGRPSVVYFNRFEGGLKVAARDTYNDFYIDLVGATNPATGAHGLRTPGMAGVDVEQVLAWDPDVLLLGNFDGAMPEDVYRSKVWRAASAVKNKRVYKVPLGGYRWDPPSHESPLMWRWLSMIAFPDRPPFDLRGAVAEEYRFLYGTTPTDGQLDQVLWLDANAGSAGYERFHAT